jgi:Family of unknown function (DUF6281)
VRILAILGTAFALVAAGCGSKASTVPSAPKTSSSASASCVLAVEWNGTTYAGGLGQLYATVKFGEPLGSGLIPACNDTGENDEEDQPVKIISIDGVDPAVAIGMEGFDQPLFAPGYVLESTAHPLHEAVYRNEPDETKGFRCRDPLTVMGRLEFTPGFATVIRLQGVDDTSISLLRQYDRNVWVDAHTEFSGLDRSGIPYLEKGAELSLLVSPCNGSGGAHTLVAASVSRAS